MSEYGKLARLNNGMVVGGTCDVFFVSEELAKKCLEKYGGEIHKLDDGWLVKKTFHPASENDPIVQVIRKSLKESGLTDSNLSTPVLE